jgi:hypothetical protein
MNQPSYQDLWYAKEQSDRDSLINGYSAAEKEVQLASRDLADAQMRQDAQGIADANERLSQATYQKEMLQGSIQSFDEQHPAQDRYQQQYQQQPQRQYTTVDVINSMGQLIPEERSWLMKRQELVASPAGQSRLQTCYYDAMDAGLTRGSPEYFKFFDERLGSPQNGSNYSSAQTNVSQNYVVGGPSVQRQYQQSSKPYTPEMPKVSLTPKEAAKIAGVSEEVWHANNKKLQAMKRDGYYSNN